MIAVKGFRVSKPNGPMTEDELSLAQHLLHTYDRSSEMAQRLDPKFKTDTSLVRSLDSLARTASDAFCFLTGRPLGMVVRGGGMFELNITNPAAWAQLPYDERSKETKSEK